MCLTAILQPATRSINTWWLAPDTFTKMKQRWNNWTQTQCQGNVFVICFTRAHLLTSWGFLSSPADTARLTAGHLHTRLQYWLRAHTRTHTHRKSYTNSPSLKITWRHSLAAPNLCAWSSGWRWRRLGADRAVWGWGTSAGWAGSALSLLDTSWCCRKATGENSEAAIRAGSSYYGKSSMVTEIQIKDVLQSRPELGFDSQIFLLQLLQTPAGFVKGCILFKRIKQNHMMQQQTCHLHQTWRICLELCEGAEMKGELFWTKTVYFHDCGEKEGFPPTWLASRVPTKLKMMSWIPWWTYIWKRKTQDFAWTAAEGRGL